MSKAAFPLNTFADAMEDTSYPVVTYDEGPRPTFDEYIQQRNRAIYKMYKDDYTPEEIGETFKLTEEEVLNIIQNI